MWCLRSKVVFRLEFAPLGSWPAVAAEKVHILLLQLLRTKHACACSSSAIRYSNTCEFTSRSCSHLGTAFKPKTHVCALDLTLPSATQPAYFASSDRRGCLTVCSTTTRAPQSYHASQRCPRSCSVFRFSCNRNAWPCPVICAACNSRLTHWFERYILESCVPKIRSRGSMGCIRKKMFSAAPVPHSLMPLSRHRSNSLKLPRFTALSARVRAVALLAVLLEQVAQADVLFCMMYVPYHIVLCFISVLICRIKTHFGALRVKSAGF